MKFISATDIGLVRSENQDNVYVDELEGGIFAVLCDGMGGENSGSEASSLAVNAVSEMFSSLYRKNFSAEAVERTLAMSVSAANSDIYSEACSDDEKFGMGTTCVCAFVSPENIHIINVGDSRAYIFDEKGFRQITNDHTVVNMLLSQGRITKDEVENHPQRNMLIKAVGVEPEIEPDYFKIRTPEKFTLMLCSDGLCGYCSDKEIEDVLKNSSFEQSAQELIKLAIGKGGRDNITVAVIAE